MKKVYFKTFGCRTNIYDTNVMISSLKDLVVVENEDDADVVVVNSCTVTNSADSNVRSYTNRINRLGKKVVLAGCGSFSKGKELFDSNKLLGVIGHSQKQNIENFIMKKKRFFELGDLQSVDEQIVESFKDKSKAFIKIQEGCNFNCSYCIIPSVRGSARSLSESVILKQIEILSSNGYGEFVLTGTNIGSYGKDKNTSLAKLLKNISNLRGVRRVRLGSLEPVQIDDEFKEILSESWIEKHLHIALQHTSDFMLKIMRRRNELKSNLALFRELKDRGFALGTDFIVGHPGESDEVFKDAYEKFKDFPLTHLHAFTYSKKDNTHSATLKQKGEISKAKQKIAMLQDYVDNSNYLFRKSNKNRLEVLIEDKKDSYYVGYDQYFNKVKIDSHESLLKDWVFLDDYEVKKEANYAKI